MFFFSQFQIVFFHVSRSVFMVFEVPGYFFMFSGGFSWCFMIPGCFFHVSRSVFMIPRWFFMIPGFYVFFHGSRSVFLVFQGSGSVFYGSRSVLCFFVIPGQLIWVFKFPGWFFQCSRSVFQGSRSVPGWFFMVPG